MQPVLLTSVTSTTKRDYYSDYFLCGMMFYQTENSNLLVDVPVLEGGCYGTKNCRSTQ